jgi:V8-like Glu-specific endopeptidase
MNKKNAFFLLLFFALVLAACQAGASEAPEDSAANTAAEPIQEEAAEDALEAGPAVGGQDFSVVYGIDERFESCVGCALTEGVDDFALQQLAASVAVLVRPAAISLAGDAPAAWNAFPLDQRLEMTYGAPLCAEQRFGAQPAPGFCTGFLLDDQTLLTAKHCLPDAAACAQTLAVFDFAYDAEGRLVDPVNENIFQCAGLAELGSNGDFVLVTLERSTDRAGLPLSTLPLSQTLGPLAILGHPDGLPRKVALGATVLIDEPANDYFVTNLDSFAGNSGSPVIDLASYQVVGMLLGGEEDYALTDDSCVAPVVCDQSAGECSGEAVLRTAIFADWQE